MDFWKGAKRTSKILKIRNGVIRENWSNANNVGRNGNDRVK
jgi:hypothetical protein